MTDSIKEISKDLRKDAFATSDPDDPVNSNPDLTADFSYYADRLDALRERLIEESQFCDDDDDRHKLLSIAGEEGLKP